MVIIVLLAGMILSAILYRMGGATGYNTKFRDLGCPLVALITLWLMKGIVLSYWWVYLLFFGLSFGALTTYWDWLFGYDNFYAHGLGCSLATIPLLWVGLPWGIFILHTIICTIGMGLWSKFIGNDVQEEMGRGALFIL